MNPTTPQPNPQRPSRLRRRLHTRAWTGAAALAAIAYAVLETAGYRMP